MQTIKQCFNSSIAIKLKLQQNDYCVKNDCEYWLLQRLLSVVDLNDHSVTFGDTSKTVDIYLSLEDETLYQVATKQITGASAYYNGKIQVDGDLLMLVQLNKLFQTSS